MTPSLHRFGRVATALIAVGIVAVAVPEALRSPTRHDRAPVANHPAVISSVRPGPATLQTGVVAGSLLFEYPSPTDVPASWYTRMEGLDSGWARMGVYWGAIAPRPPIPSSQAADPAYPGYNWTYLDTTVRDATAAGQQLLLTFTYPPAWALGPGASAAAYANTWRPDPTAFGLFARAVAERYSGDFPDPDDPGHTLPRVRYFQVWNEPNVSTKLEPQWTRTPSGFQPASPTIYRGLLNAGYANIKAVQPGAVVLAGGLAPYGDPPGGGRMRPVSFASELMCLRPVTLTPEPCSNPAHFDGIDAHPYAVTPTIHAFNSQDTSLPDLERLRHVVAAAVRSGRALPTGAKDLWVTELDWSSDPPDPGGVSLSQQARYLALAFYQVWRQGAGHAFWYEVRDPGHTAPNLTGSGLFSSDGSPKPATEAFRFPFVAVRAASGVLTLWGRSPVPGRVAIERRGGRGWVTALTLPTTRGGIFYAQVVGVGGPLRARRGSVVSYAY